MTLQITRVSARTCLNDAVTITICEQPETGKRSWNIFDDVCHDHSYGLDFVEPKVPRIVRQLYGVMVGSGAHQTVLSGASIIQHLTSLHHAENESYLNNIIEPYKPDRLYYQLYGPHLARPHNDLYDLGTGPWDERAFSGKEVATSTATLLADWKYYEWIFEMVWYPKNRPLALAVAYAARWRRRAAALTQQRRRALERTALIKQELMAATWHPRRMVDWCLDTEEQGDLAGLPGCASPLVI